MTLPIAQLGQPILRKKTHEVSVREILTPEFQHLVDEMLATVQQESGIGLAGPQVFSHFRLFIAGVLPRESEDSPPVFEVFINPRVHPSSSKQLYGWEGCLSFRELLVLVPRYDAVQVEYYNRRGEPMTLDLKDYPARVVQHEFDHLEGILTLDRAPSTQFIIKASELEVAQKELEELSKSKG
jgi:peptide deformylase